MKVGSRIFYKGATYTLSSRFNCTQHANCWTGIFAVERAYDVKVLCLKDLKKLNIKILSDRIKLK